MTKINLNTRELKLLYLTDELRSRASNKYNLTIKTAEYAKKIHAKATKQPKRLRDKITTQALLNIGKRMKLVKVFPTESYNKIELIPENWRE